MNINLLIQNILNNKKIVFLALVMFITQDIISQCTHSIDLTDTWGDGWNGGTVTVSVNGSPVLTNITLASGLGPQTNTFTAATGDVINVTRTAAGSYPEEMRITVYSGAGTIIALMEPVAAPGTNGTGNCNLLPGENCTNAQNLASLTSPYAATTVGYANDIAACRTGYPDRIFYINVPNGSTVNIWQSTNNYDSYHYMGYGGACPGSTTLYCVDDPDTQNNTWTNSTGSAQTVWFIVDAYSGSGTFTLNWTLTAPPPDPCTSVISIGGCGAGFAQSYNGGGSGVWNTNYCAFSTPGIEQVYSFVAPSTGTYSLQVTAASGFVDYGWRAASCASGGWTCIDDINSTGAWGSMAWTAGTTYYILLDDEDGTVGTHTFYINCPVVCTTPGTPTTLSGSATGQTTANISWAAGVPAGSATITYYWEVHLNSSDALIASGSTAALSAGVTGLSCNTTYHFHVRAYTSCNATYSAWAGPSGTFTTNACVGGPCGSAISIGGCGAGNAQAFSFTGAGVWDESFCGWPLPGNEKIYSYVAPSTGTYNIQVTASAGGYVDYAWRASPCQQTSWNCIDDINTTGTYGPFSWTAGTTYYLLLDGENTSSALSGTFYITCPIVAPANNDCPGTNLTPGAICSWTAGTTAGATQTLSGCAGDANDDVWYNFVASSPNHTIDVDGNGDFDAVVELFSGNCGSLTSISCMDISLGGGVESIEALGLTPGNTYYVRVYHYYTAVPANSTFNICVYNYGDICGDYFCGPSENCGTCPDDCGACPEPVGGPYIHGTEGLQNSFFVNCLVNTCSGSYYDAGGSLGNYPNDEGSTYGWYRTFCPPAANQCLRATFNLMNIEENGGGCYDYLAVRNGSAMLSPIIWEGCRTLATRNTIAGAWSNPMIATSSNGCLTFEFYSDGSTTRAGWDISFSCVACATSLTNNDCETATGVCGSISFAGSSSGPGITSTCSGCLLTESFSNWYYFEIATSGRLSITIDPIANDDYDFALYQASSCATLGGPVRCSVAENNAINGWNTGMNIAYSDFSEDASGDCWVDAINVVAGQQYYLLINNCTAGGSGFNITGTLEGGTLVDCGLLPIDLLSFDANKKGQHVELNWTTASETNNDYFTVLKSYDANFYKPVAIVPGAGNSNTSISYSTIDEEPLTQVTYYRLKQTDFDGKFTYSEVKIVKPSDNSETLTSLNAYYSAASEEIFISFNGIPEHDYSYNVFDITGRPVRQGVISAGCSAKGYAVINASDIAQGIYSISVSHESATLQKKLIISR